MSFFLYFLIEEIPAVEEAQPTEEVQEAPVLEEKPTVQVAELKFTKPLQPALQPNEERVLE